MVPRRQADRLRRLGLARAERQQGAGKRSKEWKERKESAYVTSEAQYRFWDRNLPMGRVAHLHVLDVASGRIVDLFEGTAFELQRIDPDANVFDVSPDGRHIAFVFDPAAEKRIDNCKAIAEINVKTGRIATSRATPPGTSTPRATRPTARASPSLASNVGRVHTAPAHLALLERGGDWRR